VLDIRSFQINPFLKKGKKEKEEIFSASFFLHIIYVSLISKPANPVNPSPCFL
jgi:gamma-glutamylcysteine synthetase